MNKPFFLGILALTSITAVSAQQPNDPPPAPQGPASERVPPPPAPQGPVSERVPPPPAPEAERDANHPLTDAQIVQIVETTNDGEIAAARLEKNHGQNDQAKKLADMMIDQHQQNNKDLKSLADKLQIHPEKTKISDHIHDDSDKTAKRFEGMKGADLDRAYVDKQVEAHQKVLNKLDQELIPQAKNKDLKTLLENTRETVAEHLNHAKEVQKTVNAMASAKIGKIGPAASLPLKLW